MNQSDWNRQMEEDSGEETFDDFVVISSVGYNSQNAVVDEVETAIIGLKQEPTMVTESEKSIETPPGCEALPDEITKTIESPTFLTAASSSGLGNSTACKPTSITPSFLTSQTSSNPSPATNGSSLSNLSIEVILDKVTHLTEENQVMEEELKKFQEQTKTNIETLRELEAKCNKEEADREESRHLVLKLLEEKEQLQSQISVLESNIQLQETDHLMANVSTVNKDEQIKNLEAKLSESEDTVQQLRTLLQNNEDLLSTERYKKDVLQMIIQQQKEFEVSAENIKLEMSKAEWETERLQKNLMIENLKQELYMTKCVQGNIELGRDMEIRTLKTNIQNLNLKLENLSETNLTLGKDLEISNSALMESERQLSDSVNENILLTTKIASMMAANEKVAHLEQEVVETLRLNFLMECENRTKVEDDKAFLRLQLISLTEELQMRQNELDNLHQTHLTLATEHVNRNDAIAIQASSTSNTGNIALSGTSKISPCPVCGKDNFGDVAKLQKHAEICGLELEDIADSFVFP